MELRDESGPTKRQAQTQRAQQFIKDDVPNAYIVATPVVYAYKRGAVEDCTPHRNGLYCVEY